MSRRQRPPVPAWIFAAVGLLAASVPAVILVSSDPAPRPTIAGNEIDAGLRTELTLQPVQVEAAALAAPVAGLGTPPPTLAGAGAGAGTGAETAAGPAVSVVGQKPAPSTTTASTAQLPWNLGQRPFAASSSWNTPIPSNANYVNIGMPPFEPNNYWVDWESYAPAVWFSHPGDPLVQVSHPSGWGHPAGNFGIHLPPGVTGANGSDRSILIVDGTKVYNMWQFNRSGGTASARAFAYTDVLTGTGWGTMRGDQPVGAGITAVGHNMLAGLLIQAETDQGEIRHALQLSVDGRLNLPGFTGEAIHSDGESSSGIMKQGQRLAIPRNAQMPAGMSPLGQKVFRALQTYGAFNVDTSGGSTVLRAQSNAYDAKTIDKLRNDFKIMGPLLVAVDF